MTEEKFEKKFLNDLVDNLNLTEEPREDKMLRETKEEIKKMNEERKNRPLIKKAADASYSFLKDHLEQIYFTGTFLGLSLR